jgi:hypothetical protein
LAHQLPFKIPNDFPISFQAPNLRIQNTTFQMAKILQTWHADRYFQIEQLSFLAQVQDFDL